MPIYEYYCPDNHTVYQFYAKTLAQGKTVPKCPDNPKFKLKKLVSAFAVTKGGRGSDDQPPLAAPGSPTADDNDPRLEAAMGEIGRQMEHLDENDSKSMANLMRRIGDISGEKFDEETEEIVSKLEEGADIESFDEQMAGDEANAANTGPYASEFGEGPKDPVDPKEPRHRFKARKALRRDPKLYDYD